MKYYDIIAKSYDELHEEEQKKKVGVIKKQLKINKDTKLLDVGCGTGTSSQFDCKVTGIDPSPELLKRGKKKYPEIKFVKAYAEKLPFKNKSFDIVVSITAIQNFNNIEKGIKEIKRVGKNQFALSFLKKSKKAKDIEKIIRKEFKDYKIKKIIEDKDIILIVKQ